MRVRRERERNNDAKNNTEQDNNCNQLTGPLMDENLLCMYNGLLFIYENNGILSLQSH